MLITIRSLNDLKINALQNYSCDNREIYVVVIAG